MGCGISTLEAGEPPHTRRFTRTRHHVPPVNKPITRKDYDNGDDVEEAKTKGEEERFKEEKVSVEVKGKEEHGGDDKHVKNNNVVVKNNEHGNNGGKLHVVNVKNNEEENEERDDSFIGPGSPSFREYCYDYDSRSSAVDSNDWYSDELSTKNGSDDDSTNRTGSEKSVNSNKELEKKERRGRRFRNVINKGRNRGRRNLLNFACYNSSNQSYAEGSLNKIVGKTA